MAFDSYKGSSPEEILAKEKEIQFQEDLEFFPTDELLEKYPDLETQRKIFLRVFKEEPYELASSAHLYSPSLFTEALAEQLYSYSEHNAVEFIRDNLSLFIKQAKDQEVFFQKIVVWLGMYEAESHLSEFNFDKKAFIENYFENFDPDRSFLTIDQYPKEYHPYILEKLLEKGAVAIILINLRGFIGIDHKALSREICQRQDTHHGLVDHLKKFDEIDPSVIEVFRKECLGEGIIALIERGFIEHPTREDYDIICSPCVYNKSIFLIQNWRKFEGLTEEMAFHDFQSNFPEDLLEHLDCFPSYSFEKVIAIYQQDSRVVGYFLLASHAHVFPLEYHNKLFEDYLIHFGGAHHGYYLDLPKRLSGVRELSKAVADMYLDRCPTVIAQHLDSFASGAVDQEELEKKLIAAKSLHGLIPKPKGISENCYQEVFKGHLKVTGPKHLYEYLWLYSKQDRIWIGKMILMDSPDFYFRNLGFFEDQETPQEQIFVREDWVKQILLYIRSFKNPKEVLVLCAEQKDSKIYQEALKKRLINALKFLELSEWEFWLEQTDLTDPKYARMKERMEMHVGKILPRLLKAGLPADAKKITSLCKRFHLAIPEEIEKKVDKAEIIQEERVPRAIVEKPVDVLEDMTKFYTHQLIQIDLPTEKEKCDARLHGIDLPVRTWVDLNDMTRSFEAHERRIAHWMKNYAVFAVAKELRHQVDQLPLISKDSQVNLPGLDLTEEQRAYQQQFSHPVDQFLSLATPTEIRRFLFQAEQRFLQIGWRSSYGGEAWAQICRVLADIWKEDSPLAIQIDRIFDLQHNSGCIFDKRPERVKENDKLEFFLDFKFHQTGDFENWKKGLRRFLVLDQSDALIDSMEYFEKMRPRLEAFKEQIAAEAGPRQMKYS